MDNSVLYPWPHFLSMDCRKSRNSSFSIFSRLFSYLYSANVFAGLRPRCLGIPSACALVLATPTAIMAAIGNATRHGFLVREGDALERLASVKVVAFDKTGTLTHGTPEVVAAHSMHDGVSDDELYRLTASAEQMSEHPLGKAIAGGWRKNGGATAEVTDFTMIPGRGVSAVVDGIAILAGNPELLSEHGVAFDIPDAAEEYISRGCTVVYVATDGAFVGFIALADTLRAESAEMIDRLSELGARPVLLTGDHENAARAIADSLHISELHANCLPQDKLTHIGEYQSAGAPVCMIGDGVNDAPALKRPTSGSLWVGSAATLPLTPQISRL